jgi:heme/copper-type cytochrome/quinol oxidase subunit 3
MLNERWGRVHFWLTVIGFNLTFFVQHFLGLMGMTRRVFTYPDLPGWGALNMISTVGAFVLGIAMVIFAINIAVSLRRGKVAGDNPWDAWTLEWATTSPPPAHDFEMVPPVYGRRPLWDLAHPSAEGKAKSPQAGSPPPDKVVVGIWAFIASEAAFFLILILSYVYFNGSTKAAESFLDVKTTGIFTLCLLASSLTLHMAERGAMAKNATAARAWLLVTIGLGAVFMVGQANEYRRLFGEGLRINGSLFASTFFTLTGFHGAHVTAGLIALGILAFLAFAGDLPHRALKAVGLYWHFVDVVWVAVFSVVYLRNVL